MGRRRRNDEEPGLMEMLLEVGLNSPAIGFAGAVVFGFLGAVLYYQIGNTKPLGKPFGLIFMVLSAAAVLGSLVGALRCLATGRDMLGRKKGESATPVETAAPDSFGPPTPERLATMTGEEFESYVADVFRRRGFRVREVGGAGDGGVDLILDRGDGIEHLVQCKLYRVWSVGEPKVREFYGAMAAHKTRCEGIILTCGQFTQPARDFAAGKPIRLIDGEELYRLASETNPLAPAVEHFSSPRPVPAVATADTAPRCPQCGAKMKLLTASRGANAGGKFWGCSNFRRTGCKGTLDV